MTIKVVRPHNEVLPDYTKSKKTLDQTKSYNRQISFMLVLTGFICTKQSLVQIPDAKIVSLTLDQTKSYNRQISFMPVLTSFPSL